jgi:putative thioredoxin
MGALPEHQVQAFVDQLGPAGGSAERAALLASGDEAALRAALDEAPADEDLIVALAELLVDRGASEEALTLLARIPETDRTRPIAAAARLASSPTDDHDATLTALLDQVKADEAARQQFLDILELMGPHDPRTAAYRKQLTARLF